jgi:unsaturated rhamnogalacturonyl hydrolase
VNLPAAKGNYLETSASGMFVYALAKGVRMGYLPLRYQAVAEKGYKGLLLKEVQTDSKGRVHVAQTVLGVGLGGEPYRDGTLAYYTGVPAAADDAKGYAAFIMASTEIEMMKTARMGRGDTVLMDAWFNSQTRRNAAGQTESFHYKWQDEANSGFSLLGRIFQSYGAHLATLPVAPTRAGLKQAQVYIIVSPDIPSKNPTPHYVQAEDVAPVVEWVKQGGVLLLMSNDRDNTEFTYYNRLADAFGIHFNAVDNNFVHGDHFEDGKLMIPAGNAIFAPKKIYMKDISSITATAPAHSVLQWQDNTVMAVAKVGKGTVLAVVDPWLYNEYMDGRRLPLEFENYPAGKELVRWLIQQVPATAPEKGRSAK